MKKTLVLSLLISFALASCTYKSQPHAKGLPPGQAKKVTGSKSAKPYAPGQQKKM